MKTFHELMTAGGIDSYANFIGDSTDYKDWFALLSKTRDSDPLTVSNFECALDLLGRESKNIQVRSFNHWGCGWIETIFVKPNTKEAEIAESIEAALSDYPVLNDEDFSNREWQHKSDYWKLCGMKERIRLCKKARVSIFSARSEYIPENVDQYIE